MIFDRDAQKSSDDDNDDDAIRWANGPGRVRPEQQAGGTESAFVEETDD